MDRRSFIRNILVAGTSCAILPSALTYAKKWKLAASTGLTRCEFKWACVDHPLEIVSPEWHSVRGLGMALYHPEYLATFDEMCTRSNFVPVT